MKTAIIGLGGIGTRVLSEMRGFETNLLLIDGDKYEFKNLSRQFCDVTDLGRNKAQAWSAKLNCEGIPEHLDVDNLFLLNDCDVILVCVDNHPSRKLVFEYAKERENCIVIAAGNDLVDGNVLAYVRRAGRDYNRCPLEYHPELSSQGIHPNNMSCAEAAVSSPQIGLANAWAALIMMCIFRNIIEKLEFHDEYCFDIEEMKVLGYEHKKP
jgi:molybdopterin/thiamine biosynthesis adenylyltransferase